LAGIRSVRARDLLAFIEVLREFVLIRGKGGVERGTIRAGTACREQRGYGPEDQIPFHALTSSVMGMELGPILWQSVGTRQSLLPGKGGGTFGSSLQAYMAAVGCPLSAVTDWRPETSDRGRSFLPSSLLSPSSGLQSSARLLVADSW
jgi:hypothetical protein